MQNEIHMLEGLEDEELERYLDENPWIVPLFEINIERTAESYASPIEITGQDEEPGEDRITELRRARRRDGTWRNKHGHNWRPA